MPPYYIFTGVVLLSGLAVFAITSHTEKETIAARRAWIAAIGLLLFWTTAGLLLPHLTSVLAVAVWVAILGGFILLSLPIGTPEPLQIDEGGLKRYDERHVIFGRMGLEPNTQPYGIYYGEMKPDLQRFDDHLRSMPHLGEPGGKYAHDLDSSYFTAIFRYIEDFRHLVAPEVAVTPQQSLTPAEATGRIKGFAKYLGALDVRVTRLKAHHVYEHAGRHLHNWGEPQEPRHRYAVVISVAMDHAMIHSAPLNPAVTETSFQYLNAANIAIVLAYYTTQIGYRARAHVDGNYQVLCTALAHEAGIGELGRQGLIITPTHGPRVRLSVVTTDLPLLEDGPINIGVQHFCAICKKCADNCPSGSIEKGDKKEVRGVFKWQSNMESCFQFWLRSGTDCGICLAVCPYAKPDTFLHRIVRGLASRNILARHLALRLDDIFYTRRPRHIHKPDWFSPHDTGMEKE